MLDEVWPTVPNLARRVPSTVQNPRPLDRSPTPPILNIRLAIAPLSTSFTPTELTSPSNSRYRHPTLFIMPPPRSRHETKDTVVWRLRTSDGVVQSFGVDKRRSNEDVCSWWYGGARLGQESKGWKPGAQLVDA